MPILLVESEASFLQVLEQARQRTRSTITLRSDTGGRALSFFATEHARIVFVDLDSSTQNP